METHTHTHRKFEAKDTMTALKNLQKISKSRLDKTEESMNSKADHLKLPSSEKKKEKKNKKG